ncbi:pentatricopeptide repeat-containing protein At5g61990, mitochondrial-like [Cryptomeria japonica]|uniref:pentatricopeptide repeat-containing protein At5g61990, mitochondrial-like n=1 Tax=Cryptomeria japonica TaxID=3369 RepID=UPI0025AC2685|nr:pentatricopeptide repeat-containing protein At5g61990, mitochondrial-like [Cryptomeria japonica]
MPDEGLTPNAITYNHLIDAHCKIGEIDKALKHFSNMKVAGISPNVVTYSKLIDFFFKKNKLDMALSMLNEMRTKDLVLDVFTYDSLFRSFKQRHDLVKTFWLMDQMKKEGCAPSDAIVRTLNWLVDVGEMKKLSDFVNEKIK